MLLAVALTGQDGEQELPVLENEVHGRPDKAAGKGLASGLEEDLSMG
jgi:hypothetical protein